MLMTIISFLSVSQEITPSETETPKAYAPVAYRSAQTGDGLKQVTLPSGTTAEVNAPAKIRPSRYVSRGNLGLESDVNEMSRGLRIEVRTGWDRITLGATGDDGRSDGLIHGISAGYDRPLGRAFLGVFASLDGSTAETSGVVATSPDPLSGVVLETQFETSVAYALELGFRAGWWITEDWNVFADSAITQLKVDVSSEIAAISPTIGGPPVVSEPFFASDSETATGWRLGAGTEANLTDHLYTTAKYRFTFYDEDDAGADTEQFEILTGVGLRF